MNTRLWPVPRQPVFGWQAWEGARRAGQPCMLDLPNCHLTTSGRASITLALETLSVQPGEPVLLPTYHCPTMVAPAVKLRAHPHFYPVDVHGAPDLAWLDRQDLRGVRVLLAAHFFGIPQRMACIRKWCDARGIALIEDCAHALFGSSDGRPIGSWGDIAIGSLTKFLPVPEGGCLVINSGQPAPSLTPCSIRNEVKAWIDVLEEGAAHGRLTGLNHVVTGPLWLKRRLRRSAYAAPDDGDPADDSPQAIGTPAEALAIDMPLAHRHLQQACRVMAARLPRQRIAERRRKHYAELTRRLSGHEGLRPLLPHLPETAVPYVFPLWVQAPDPGYLALRAKRIPVFRWDRLWRGVPCIAGDSGVDWAHHVIQLACHQDLVDADLDRLVNAVLAQYEAVRAGR